MSIIDEIFSEYVRMRDNGLETKEALRALKIFVDPLPRQDKETLAGQLRAWELRDSAPGKPAKAADADQSSGKPRLKSIKPPPPRPSEAPESSGKASGITRFEPDPNTEPKYEEVTYRPFTPQDSEAEAESVRWVACANCTKKNRANDIFCYACGQLLEGHTSSADTRTFASATGELFDGGYFGMDSVLMLILRDAKQVLELRPQLRGHELVVGRSSENSVMAPDVDLADANAAELGVSRLHMALRYTSNDQALQLYDLGSANGTFINGQRIHPKEIRVLRNGDELRLGRMVVRVRYLHPGEEITSKFAF
jgi:hypothetical protein